MILRVKFLPYLCLGMLAWSGLPLHATDWVAWRVGDKADADIITPVTLDVVDAAATAALQSARARQVPAIFRRFPEATNLMADGFIAAFALAHTNFLDEMTQEFHTTTLDATTIASADFAHLVTGFGVKHQSFPVADELAAEWAQGGDGQVIRDKLLATLQQATARRICPDILPDGMVVGDTIHLVPVTAADQKLSPDTVLQSPLLPAASLTPIATVRAQFRRDFPAGQQLFARALAAFIQPNCLPDAPFTELTRGTALSQIIVANHFDAGDPLVHRGDLIDANAKAALTALNEKLRSTSPTPSAVLEDSRPSPPATPAPSAAAVVSSTTGNPATPTVKAGMRHEGLIVTLAGISTGALLVFGWQVARERKRALVPAPAVQLPMPLTNTSHTTNTSLAPEVAQAVREAVVQELAAQRRELLLAHQAATEEIAALVRRLDELQVPMQERLHTYETRIQTLEQELAIRTAENRELLKLKIETTRQQLQTELAGTATTASAP
jgi:hypothetical protein